MSVAERRVRDERCGAISGAQFPGEAPFQPYPGHIRAHYFTIERLGELEPLITFTLSISDRGRAPIGQGGHDATL